jgi:hypothetical protein
MIMYANSESADVLTLSLIVKPNEVRPHINAMLRQMPSHAIAYASVHQLLWPNRVPLEDSPPAHGVMGCHGVLVFFFRNQVVN